MSTHAPSGSLRPALPPTLQPMAIALAAPRTDRRTALLASAVIYLFIPAALMAAGRAIPHGVTPHTGPVTFDLIEPGGNSGGAPPLAVHPPVEPARPADPPKLADLDAKVSMDQIPMETPDALPTVDQSGTDARDPNGPVGVIGGRGTDKNSSIIGPGTCSIPNSTTSDRPIQMDATGLRILHQESPSYPTLARAMKLQGQVVLRMVIDANGVPTSVGMEEGNPVFRTEAERSARLWRFEPAKVNGAAVPATFLLTLKFRLN